MTHCVSLGWDQRLQQSEHQSRTATPNEKGLCPTEGHRKAQMGAGMGTCCTRCCQSGQGRGPTVDRGGSHRRALWRGKVVLGG